MSGWGQLFGKIADQFQGRVERLKNEREKLLNEREELFKKDFTAIIGNRVIAVDKRLQEIETILRNKTSD